MLSCICLVQGGDVWGRRLLQRLVGSGVKQCFELLFIHVLKGFVLLEECHPCVYIFVGLLLFPVRVHVFSVECIIRCQEERLQAFVLEKKLVEKVIVVHIIVKIASASVDVGVEGEYGYGKCGDKAFQMFHEKVFMMLINCSVEYCLIISLSRW